MSAKINVDKNICGVDKSILALVAMRFVERLIYMHSRRLKFSTGSPKLPENIEKKEALIITLSLLLKRGDMASKLSSFFFFEN